MTTITPASGPSIQRAGALLHWLRRLGPVLALLAVFGFFTLRQPDSFPTLDNLLLILRQSALLGIAALGMTVVMILGGIDLSVGSVAVLASVITALTLNQTGNPMLALGAGILSGALCGLTTGSLVAGLRMMPFIVTLGMMCAVRGLSKYLAGNTRVSAAPTWLNELLAQPQGSWRWLVLPPGVWIMLGLAVALAVMLHFTRLGRHIVAIGSSEPTARLCGVRVGRVKVWAYTLMGALAGLAGVLLFARLGVGSPTEAVGMELTVIAAVVIGGCSLSGGQGSIVGALAGTLLMSVIRSGCAHAGWESYVEEIVTGVIIVVAVAIDRLAQGRAIQV